MLDGFFARLGRTLTGDQLARASAALDDALAYAQDVGGPDWTAETIPDAAKTVVLAAALRAFHNPHGATQRSVGDSSESLGSVPSAVFFTQAERGIVRRAAGRSAAGSMTLVSPYSGDAL